MKNYQLILKSKDFKIIGFYQYTSSVSMILLEHNQKF